MAIESLRQRYEAAGQGHLLQFWPQLSDSERQQLQTQLEALDIERVNRIYKMAVGAEKELAVQAGQEAIEPLPEDAAGSVIGGNENEKRWRSIGLKAVANGGVLNGVDQKVDMQAGNGKPVELSDLFFRYTLDVVTDFLLGKDVQSLT